ncbi:MAG: two-component regulator propeller domain-containing protein [Bacteroidota bacterium]
MKSFNLLIILLVIWVSSLGGAEIRPGHLRIEKIANEHGFYQNTIRAIASDANGYLWFATPNGLVRYDGYFFEYFYHDIENPASIPNNYVTHLLKDSNEKLWIGTKEGMCLYDADSEQFKPLNYSPQNVAFIKEGPLNRIWAANKSKLFTATNTIWNLNNLAIKEIKDSQETEDPDSLIYGRRIRILKCNR